jgi:multidrug efflux pump subunit AcrB
MKAQKARELSKTLTIVFLIIALALNTLAIFYESWRGFFIIVSLLPVSMAIGNSVISLLIPADKSKPQSEK